MRDEVVSKIGGPRNSKNIPRRNAAFYLGPAENNRCFTRTFFTQVLPILDWKLFKCGYNMSQISGSCACRMGDVFFEQRLPKNCQFFDV